MKILLNLFAVSSGGGQQVALNLLRSLSLDSRNHNWYILVSEGSELEKVASELFPSDSLCVYGYSYFNRLLVIPKIRKLIRLHNIGLVYNFGPCIPFIRCKQVVRTVYSNLYYPEVDFWKDYSFRKRCVKKIIDFFRLRGTLSADALIFENEDMLYRASRLHDYPSERATYVAPSVTQFEQSWTDSRFEQDGSDESYKILYLSSWHLNKQIHILPAVASKLKSKGVKVKFLLSLSDDSTEVERFLTPKIEYYKVNDYFKFLGKVEAKYVHQVVKGADAMILLSKLECFSSNVIEAFFFGKPLIISDEAWARSACDDAALFVDRDSVESIGKAVESLNSDIELQEDLKRRGKARLSSFNSPEEKVDAQIEFLERFFSESAK
ncbi:glycosyltransferase family 4 protein [Idiomarina baltica]|uniref:Transferase protein n=1 Tax=Idiomarina baltica OS145 TaxID=314276 RepID=A0ABM9WLS3_9GAMM|nr:glycosyltransferase [Idiomarina baltica]EAQ31905.1 putative transferase protein [Idiomarina baltica OS145]